MRTAKIDRGRRAIAFLLCAFCAAMVAFPVGTAFAYSWPNKPYATYATGSNVTWTPAETKDSDSSSWQHNTWISCSSAECYIDAATNSNNNPIEVNSPRYGWNSGDTGFLDNYVKEHGNYPRAILYFRSYAPSYTCTGEWTPDCDPCS